MARTTSDRTDTRELKTTSVTDPAENAAVSTAIVNQYSGVIITTTGAANAQVLQDPTNTTDIDRFTVINDDSSTDSVTVNGIVVEPAKQIAFVWDGDAWTSTITGGTGDVSKVGTPADNQVGVWTGDGTIEGTSGLTYDGSELGLTGDETFAAGANRTISVATDNTEGDQISVVAGSGGTGDVNGGAANLKGGAAGSGGNNTGGAVNIAGGVDAGTDTGGSVNINGGAGDTNGSVNIGSSNTAGVNVGAEMTMSDDIQLGETSIKLDDTLSADAKWSGITTSGVLGATIAIGDLCYLNADDSRWELVDANLSDGYDKQLGISLTAGNDADACEMLLYGKVRSAVFPAFTVGSPLYMSETAGDVTHTAPVTSAAAVRKLGNALTAEDFMFNPSDTVIVLS